MSYNKTQVVSKKDAQGKFSLLLKPGDYVFSFYYNNNFYEITTSSIPVLPQNRMEIEVLFHDANFPTICRKPVIYIYPKIETQINVKLELKGQLDFTYPVYNPETGWSFSAGPSGTITTQNKKYNYLFWEGVTTIETAKINSDEGFIVSKPELVNFFEEKLSAMGFNSKESADFITYWAPLMSANEKNYIHFLFNEEFAQYAKLTITPTPDKVFRVFMLWSKAEENSTTVLIPQQIQSFERTGFTVVEWGGTEQKINFKL
ncbi:MAG: hypothetical protein IAF38_17445 [Bacteroidia bacterium]|nr:hypothetical protein [Bacteroidia bacterium]